MTDDAELQATLRMIARRGPIGENALDGAIEHSERFVRLIPETAQSVVDLGSGGGLPGLVIAVRRPELEVRLVERRQTRADLLRRAVARLGLANCIVDGRDARDVGKWIVAASAEADAVTARAFGTPELTVRAAAPIVRAGGLVLVAEPPELDDAGRRRPTRWPPELLEPLRLVDAGVVDSIQTLRKVTSSDEPTAGGA